MTLHEAQGKSGTNDLYERFTANCNDEMSIAVLGNTLTTKSDTNGTQALGTVQAKEQMKITEDDVQFILDLLNYEMTDIFAVTACPPITTIWSGSDITECQKI